jgi:large subunit ribosomal protein L41
MPRRVPAPAPQNQTRMVFATAVAFARRARRVGFNTLTTKMAKKGFYKGKGAINPGVRTRVGAYKLVPWKRPDYIVPSGLSTTSLRPYVERVAGGGK